MVTINEELDKIMKFLRDRQQFRNMITITDIRTPEECLEVLAECGFKEGTGRFNHLKYTPLLVPPLWMTHGIFLKSPIPLPPFSGKFSFPYKMGQFSLTLSFYKLQIRYRWKSSVSNWD